MDKVNCVLSSFLRGYIKFLFNRFFFFLDNQSMSEENKLDELTKIVQLEKPNRISELYNIYLDQILYLKNIIQSTELCNELE